MDQCNILAYSFISTNLTETNINIYSNEIHAGIPGVLSGSKPIGPVSIVVWVSIYQQMLLHKQLNGQEEAIHDSSCNYQLILRISNTQICVLIVVLTNHPSKRPPIDQVPTIPFQFRIFSVHWQYTPHNLFCCTLRFVIHHIDDGV